MKKSDRELVFNKFGGRCSYCGCDLSGKKWHVDHAEAVERKRKMVGGGYYHKITGEPMVNEFRDDLTPEFWKDYEYKERKAVADGFRFPENHHIDNMMPACISCNVNKSSMNIEQFRNFIAGFVSSLNKYQKTYAVVKRYGLVEETGKPVVFYFETHQSETPTV